MRLMRIASCVLPVIAVALAMAVPVRAEELALNTSLPSRILLDLQRREISVLLDGRMRGSWPVAIGDPKTPTPQGEFSILTKKIDPIYVSEKSGQRKELSGPTSCLLYTSPSPRDLSTSRMPSSA